MRAARAVCLGPASRAVAVVCTAALVSGLFVADVSGATGPIPLDCNRACLEGVIDQYLKALVAHDPKYTHWQTELLARCFNVARGKKPRDD